MVTSLPRVVIAAPSTGQGKTTVATGLMAALRASDHAVSGHKVGPDYIDPGYHALATGRPGRNLDPHLVGENRVTPLLLHGARDADVAVVEGVMGLHDGRLGTRGFASTAHVAALTDTPVVLVVDVDGMSRSAAAVVVGMATFDSTVRVAGVILNRAGSSRNTAEIRSTLEDFGYPVLGALPRDEGMAAPSRHLGLVPAVEREQSERLITRLGEQVAAHVDLDAVLEVARTAPDLIEDPWDPAQEVYPSGRERPVVAVAGGRAFTFRYPETEELLRAAGCDVVTFDPAVDTLPPGTRGIYLGGGFPEIYATELAANTALLHQIRAAVKAGVPTVAECAGLLYLADRLDGRSMAGVIPAEAAMADRLTLRYPVAAAPGETLLTRPGEKVRGHEFHRTRTTPSAGPDPAWTIDGAPTGFADSTLHASYLHVHWAGYPLLAQRFADAAHRAPVAEAAPEADSPAVVLDAAAPAAGATAWSALTDQGSSEPRGPRPGVELSAVEPSQGEGTSFSPQRPDEPAADPLRHHGDRDALPGLVDFAVNVHPEPRPAWLNLALAGSLTEVGRYPDPTAAAELIAAYHARSVTEVLPTSGVAEAFTLVARCRPWRRPVVVHPQFTTPHAALEAAGHTVTPVLLTAESGFALDPSQVPEDADLVVIGNPTNPTGVLHPAPVIRSLMRPGRLVVVDEAFLDGGPAVPETLVSHRDEGLLVLRSLTKLWTVPGVRAGYAVGGESVIRELARQQPPWAVSSPALAAIVACLSPHADGQALQRAAELVQWREALQDGLFERRIEHVPSQAPFVLARLDGAAREFLRSRGIATRTGATFPGLDEGWTRLAARPPKTLERLFAALDVRPRD